MPRLLSFRRRLLGVALVGAGLSVLVCLGVDLMATDRFEAHAQARLQRIASGWVANRSSPGALPADSLSAPPSGTPVARLVIARAGVDQVVVEGVGAQQLMVGPGHYPGTALPGEPGNVAIAGHRTTYGHPFFALDALGAGDPIDLLTPAGRFSYAVRSTIVVAPGDVSVLAPTALPTLTLTTCTPRYSAARRLVVQAVLVRSTLWRPVPSAARGHRALALVRTVGDPVEASEWALAVRAVPYALTGGAGAGGALLLGLHARHTGRRSMLVVGPCVTGLATAVSLLWLGILLPILPPS